MVITPAILLLLRIISTILFFLSFQMNLKAVRRKNKAHKEYSTRQDSRAVLQYNVYSKGLPDRAQVVSVQAIPLACFQGPSQCLHHDLRQPDVPVDVRTHLPPQLSLSDLHHQCSLSFSVPSLCPHDSAPHLSACLSVHLSASVPSPSPTVLLRSPQ